MFLLRPAPSHRWQEKDVVFGAFTIVLFLMLLIENSMVYYFPIVARAATHSTGIIGLIIGLTNIAALACDFIIPRMFKRRTWHFLIFFALLFQIGFPLFTNMAVLSHVTLLFVLAALFWNIYFEFLAFARHNFVITQNQKQDYSKNWAFFSVIFAVDGLIGPILGSALLRMSMFERMSIMHGMQSVALILIVLLITTSKHEVTQIHHTHPKLLKLSLLRELGIWKIIGTRILPVLLVGFWVTLINASIATIGGLLGEQLFHNGFDWLPIFVFDAASILAAFFFWKQKVALHKKHWSQIALLLGSLSLTLLYFFPTTPVIILTVFFVCSVFVSSAWVLGEAVYSDLAERADTKKYYIDGMERVDDSVGWLLAPIAIGFLSDRYGFITSLSIIGVLGAVLCVILLWRTPRKIRLPQEKLATYDP